MKVLIVCTNHDIYPNKTSKTGLWLSELTHFYEEMSKRRVLMDIVSPMGRMIPVDERSLDLKDECNAKYWQDGIFRNNLENSLALADVTATDYRLVYLAGGHGAMWDFPDNVLLQNIIKTVYERHGMISAVSHGVAGLLNVKLSDDSWLVEDKYITGASNMEETLMTLVSEMPFSLEDKLKERGTHFTKSMIPFMEFIELDERLITGQNPGSAKKVASKALEELFEK